MGGFVTRDGHHPIVTKAQLGQYLRGIGEIKEEDIKDKSKSNNLLKCLTLVQVVWFSVQCASRLHGGLPISKLETVTIGLAVIHMWTWGLWRKKPQNVSRTIPIDPVSPTRISQLGPKLNLI
jgi:hypothetical protein